MKTRSKTKKMETSNASVQSAQEALREPRRLRAGSTLGDLRAEIYCGLIWR
jgi:hypothetical protein